MPNNKDIFPESPDDKPEYHLYEDPLLAIVRQGDVQLDNDLVSLRLVEERLAQDPDNATFRTMAELAEEKARDRIENRGYATSEPPPEFPDQP